MESVIDKFSGQYRWLSNFHPVTVYLDGVKYPSVENAYVAAKTVNKELRKPLEVMSSAQAKAYGKTLELRYDWNSVKLKVMEKLLRQKFLEPDLWEKLIDTGNIAIVEGNTWHDLWWGVCTCEEHKGSGQNHLGKLIMKIRSELTQIPLDFGG